MRVEETNLGNITNDANLWYARQFDPSVMISIKNGGGIRDSIGSFSATGGGTQELPPAGNPDAGKMSGDISQLDVQNSLRFNNGLSVVTLSAAELERVLEHAVASTAPGATPGQFAQISGISFSFDATRQAQVLDNNGNVTTAGDRIRSASITDQNGNIVDVLVRDGQLVGDANRGIRTVTLDFLANAGSTTPGLGGDRYPIPAYGENRLDLRTAFSTVVPDTETFAAQGTEQDAFAEYLKEFFATRAYSQADTGPAADTRIQNVAARADTVLAVPALRTGTPGDDVLDGDGGINAISGLGGNDTIRGLAGNDQLFGDDGDDLLLGEAGGDYLAGWIGNDILRGGSEDDRLLGQGGNDQLFGDEGNDILEGDEGDDFLAGWIGNDMLRGGAGDDKILGQDGVDQIYGDDGDDILEGGGGNDFLAAWMGTDTLRGEAGDDRLLAQGGDDQLFGDDGNDTLEGGEGDDVLFGWIGNDRLVGDAGNDRMLGQDGNDTFVFRPGFGRDAIVDFTAGAGTPDVIEFSTSVFGNFAAVQAASQQVGANTVIRVDADNFIILEQVQRANLDASDFMFV